MSSFAVSVPSWQTAGMTIGGVSVLLFFAFMFLRGVAKGRRERDKVDAAEAAERRRMLVEQARRNAERSA